jgi:hypothetical protein
MTGSKILDIMETTRELRTTNSGIRNISDRVLSNEIVSHAIQIEYFIVQKWKSCNLQLSQCEQVTYSVGTFVQPRESANKLLSNWRNQPVSDKFILFKPSR